MSAQDRPPTLARLLEMTFCEIDWAALGTWAAVAAALWISVADKFRLQREVAAHSRTLAFLILPVMTELDSKLDKIDRIINNPANDTVDWYAAVFATNAGTRAELRTAVEEIDTNPIVEYLRSWLGIEPFLAAAIARSASSVYLLKAISILPWEEIVGAGKEYESPFIFFSAYRKELKNSQTALAAALATCRRHIKSIGRSDQRHG